MALAGRLVGCQGSLWPAGAQHGIYTTCLHDFVQISFEAAARALSLVGLSSCRKF